MSRLLRLCMAVLLLIAGCGPADTGDFREVKVTARDLHFDLSEATFKVGERIKFVITNEGQQMHEFHLQHGRKEFMVHSIMPGKSKELKVNFTESGQYDVACFVANHHLAGMTSQITVNQ